MLLGFTNTTHSDSSANARLSCAVLTNEQMAMADNLAGTAQGDS